MSRPADANFERGEECARAYLAARAVFMAAPVGSLAFANAQAEYTRTVEAFACWAAIDVLGTDIAAAALSSQDRRSA
jgi:hypothetical protein